MTRIEIRQAAFGYRHRPVVEVEHLDLHPGRCLGIFGPNGSGKTTLIRGVAGLLPPLKGTVKRPDTAAGAQNSLHSAKDLLRIGYLPQHRALELHWPMTGLDAAGMAVSARRRVGWIGSARQELKKAMSALDVEELGDRPFSKLSGGQQQRLLLAGALAANPHVLFLDEPTDGLDFRSRDLLLHILRQETNRGLCTVIVSHDVQDLLTISDEVVWLHPGETFSTVEIIAPQSLAERVLATRRIS